MESSAAGPIEPGDLTIVPASQVFADAVFTEVSSPSVRRVVMRVEFSAGK